MQDGAISGSDKGLWDQFIDELATKDLESALHSITLSDHLSDHVVSHTWNLVGASDARAFDEVLGDSNRLPLSGFTDTSSTARTGRFRSMGRQWQSRSHPEVLKAACLRVLRLN